MQRPRVAINRLVLLLVLLASVVALVFDLSSVRAELGAIRAAQKDLTDELNIVGASSTPPTIQWLLLPAQVR
jgi:hypothetical protein